MQSAVDWLPTRMNRERATRGTPTGGSFTFRWREVGLLRFAIAGLVLVTISRIHDYIGLVGVFRPGLLLLGAALLALALFPSSARFDQLGATWVSRVVLAFVAGVCLSTLTGLSMGASGTFVLEYFSRVAILFGLLVIAVVSLSHLYFLVSSYALSLLLLVFFVVFIAGVNTVAGYTRVGDTAMYDGNDLGVVLLSGLPLSLVLLRAGSPVARALGLSVLVAAPLCIVLTASRGGFLGLCAGVLAMLALSPGVSVFRKLGILVATATTVAVAAPDGYWDRMSTILHPEEDYNVTDETGRFAIWSRGLGYVAERPVLGVGPNNFVRAGWTISDVARGLAGRGLRDQSPHNSFLQVWAELGTFGLLCWLSIIVGGTIGFLRIRARRMRGWLQGTPDQRVLFLMVSYLPACFIGFSVAAFFTSHAYSAMFYVMAAFSASTLLLLRQELARPTTGPGSRVPRTVRTPEPFHPRPRTVSEGTPIPLPTALSVRRDRS